MDEQDPLPEGEEGAVECCKFRTDRGQVKGRPPAAPGWAACALRARVSP